MSDLISRDDVIRALNGACSNWEDDAKVQEIVMAIPSAKPTGDLISRADAIEALCHNCAYYTDAQCKTDSGYWCESGAMIREALPSAEAVKVAYICDGRKCDSDCSECFRTLDIEHARDFTLMGDTYFQQEAEAVQGWIPFTRRPMTEEEQKDYPNCTFMFDCVLPDDGDEILVSNRRFVWMDTFCSDIDGCYLDGGDDIDEDMAWMPLPTPYKGGEDE